MINDETLQRLRKKLLTALFVDAGTPDEERYVDDKAKFILDDIMPVVAAEIERAEVAGMEKAKNIIAGKMKRDIKALEPYLKDLQSKTGGDNAKSN